MDADGTDYSIARWLFGIGEFFGWVTVVFGVALAVFGAVSFSPLSGAFTGLPNVIIRLLGALPGLSGMVSGFVMVMIIYSMRATVDTAETMQQLLRVARREQLPLLGPFPTGPHRQEPPAPSEHSLQSPATRRHTQPD